MNKRAALWIISVCAVVFLVLSPFIGMKAITLDSIFSHDAGDISTMLFWKIRIPRVITAFCAGAALAMSGLAFQALFKNPLAEPFTLGVSSGAALGTALYLRAGIVCSIFRISGQTFSSFAGALIAILLVYGLTRVKKGFSTATMLLAGVAVSFFCSSLILFIQYMSDLTETFHIIRWLMGGFEIVGYSTLVNILPFFLFGNTIVFLLTHELNLMMAGEDIAISRGVNVKRIKTILFFATSLMVGSIVSVCGPIGFVGMMSPHICRLVIGPDHRFLTPATFMFGGLLLTMCDTLSRTIIAPSEIPVGIVTALIGGPFFIWLLVSGSSERSMLSHF
jgi:iron complex transport system permease protein